MRSKIRVSVLFFQKPILAIFLLALVMCRFLLKWSKCRFTGNLNDKIDQIKDEIAILGERLENSRTQSGEIEDKGQFT